MPHPQPLSKCRGETRGYSDRVFIKVIGAAMYAPDLVAGRMRLSAPAQPSEYPQQVIPPLPRLEREDQ
jgi:hypothetical protein